MTAKQQSLPGWCPVLKKCWVLIEDPRFALQRKRDAAAARFSLASKLTAPVAPARLYAKPAPTLARRLYAKPAPTAPRRPAPAGWVDVTVSLKRELGIV